VKRTMFNHKAAEDGWDSVILRHGSNLRDLSRYLMKVLQKSGCSKTPVFCEGVEMVHFPHPNFGS